MFCYTVNNCPTYWFNEIADWLKADRKCGQGYQIKKTGNRKSRAETLESPADTEDNNAALRKGAEPHG